MLGHIRNSSPKLIEAVHAVDQQPEDLQLPFSAEKSDRPTHVLTYGCDFVWLSFDDVTSMNFDPRYRISSLLSQWLHMH